MLNPGAETEEDSLRAPLSAVAPRSPWTGEDAVGTRCSYPLLLPGEHPGGGRGPASLGYTPMDASLKQRVAARDRLGGEWPQGPTEHHMTGVHALASAVRP